MWYKYEAAGNDFIVIDDRTCSFPLENPIFVQKICLRKCGIGADGVILLQLDSQADFRMIVFNSDGSRASSCGNGLRSLLHFIKDLSIVSRSIIRVRTGEQIVKTFWDDRGRAVVDMGIPRGLTLHLKTEEGEVHFVDTGVPHAIQFVPDVEQVDLLRKGTFLRRHPLFGAEGANVDFAALQEDGSIRVRTFERGVEGETLSCGTGALAVSAAAQKLFGLPTPITLCFRGGILEVWEQDQKLFLTGPVQKVCSVGDFNPK